MDTTAFNPAAPQAERTDALSQLMEHYRPSDSAVREVIDYISEDLATGAMLKAQSPQILLPGQRRGPGPRSLEINDMQVLINGEFIERPGTLNFAAMRAMVDQTPILSSVVLTRVRQVMRFCRTQESGSGPGFAIRHRDREHQLTGDERQSVQLLSRFFDNCGWEFNPRRRRLMHRDSFSQFMAKLTRDSLTMDAAAIETEFKRDTARGIDGLYAVDGATIRLCTEEGYNGDDRVVALQVVDGMIRTTYTINDLIYEPRNPRTDILAAGYGMGEVEMLVKVVTGYLNALTYNTKYFDSNAIPKGVLHLSGNYSDQDLNAFKRYWNAQVKGVNNAWTVPVLTSKDQESRAGFERFGVDQNEMMFARWMTFLTSIICAVFGMDPAEINSEGFSAGSSPLSGSDTAERLAASKDKGLRPLLGYFENLLTDYVVGEFGDKYVFRWTGLDEEDEEKRHEMRKMTLTWNEARAEQGMDAVDSPLGDAPLNPSLIGPWMQLQQASGEEDFGQPDEQGGDPEQDPAAGAQGAPGGDEIDEEDQEGQGDEPPQDGAPPAEESEDEQTVAKSFGLAPLDLGRGWD